MINSNTKSIESVVLVKSGCSFSLKFREKGWMQFFLIDSVFVVVLSVDKDYVKGSKVYKFC